MVYLGVMLLLAVTTAAKSTVPATALDRLKAIPLDFWIRIGIAVLVLVALIFFLKKVAKMNKVVVAAVTFIAVTVVGFNWVYERSEPPWATPAVNFLAGFLPTKGPPPKKARQDLR